MKEKVYINIKGLQLAAQNVPRDYEEDEDDPVEVINVGRYRIINGKEYIKYDEVLEGTTKNVQVPLKLREIRLRLQKRSCNRTPVFCAGRKNDDLLRNTVW